MVSIIVFNVKNVLVWLCVKNFMLYVGSSVQSIVGCCVMLSMFSVVIFMNYIVQIGLNIVLMCFVLCFCIQYSVRIIFMVIGIMQCFRCGVVIFKFFIVDSIDMVGVIMLLLQNNVVLKMFNMVMVRCSCGRLCVLCWVNVISVMMLFLFLLFVCMMNSRYFIDIMRISDQNIKFSVLSMLLCEVGILCGLNIFLSVYSGLVLMFLQIMLMVFRVKVVMCCFDEVCIVKIFGDGGIVVLCYVCIIWCWVSVVRCVLCGNWQVKRMKIGVDV